MAAAPDFALAQQAAGDGMRSRLSQANNLKRAIPASRDPELCELHVTPALVREAEKVIDKDPGLVGFIEQAVRDTYDRPGRPAVLSFRTALVCFWLLDPFAPLPGPGGHIPAPPRRTKRRPATWGRGAAWVGRGRNKQKSVFGYALHTMSATDPSQPPVIEAAALTPAPALPAPAVVPLLRHLHDVRLADPKVAQALSEGNARILGNIVADPAYTINVDRWQLPIRSLGADAIFRLHATMQAGRKTVRGAAFVDGRPYCRCIPDTLARLRYPKFPFNSTTLNTHHAQVALRDTYEMKPNAGYKKNGSRQFKHPHFAQPRPGGASSAANAKRSLRTPAKGGCDNCVDAYGNAVLTPTTGVPRPRCCTKRTKTFSAKELALYQPSPHGSPAWQLEWNPRNRVEGGYGILKNLALVNWGHGYHHFVGLARESLVAAFAIMAMNFHIQRTWKVRKDLTTEPAPHPTATLPSDVPLQLTPQGLTSARKEREAAERQAARQRGPKGLAVLGTTPAAP